MVLENVRCTYRNDTHMGKASTYKMQTAKRGIRRDINYTINVVNNTIQEMVQSRLTVRLIMIQLLLVFQVLTTDAFHSSIQLRRHDHPLRSSPTYRNSPTTLLWAAAKKGFGKTTTNPPSSKPDPAPSTTTTTTSNPSSINSELEIVATSVTPESSSPTTSKMNAGQRALQELRRQKIEERDQELRQVRDMIQADEQVQNSGPVAIPEKVAQRMGLRMLPFVGLPFFGGMMAFVAFWYFATYQNLQFEPTLVAASTIALLVVGLLVSQGTVVSHLFAFLVGN